MLSVQTRIWFWLVWDACADKGRVPDPLIVRLRILRAGLLIVLTLLFSPADEWTSGDHPSANRPG